MRNVQSRVIDAPVSEIGALLDRFGSADDALWPSAHWAAAILDRGLEPGSTGGHGVIRYSVTEYVPGRRVRLQFAPEVGIDGFHELIVTPRGPGRSELSHVIDGKVRGSMRVLWPLAVRWLHEAVLHDLLDNAERETTGALKNGPARWSPLVRVLRRIAPE